MTGLADVDGFKLCIQVYVWLGFLPLFLTNLHNVFVNILRAIKPVLSSHYIVRTLTIGGHIFTVCLHVTFLNPCPLLPPVIKCVLFIVRITERKWVHHIYSIHYLWLIHTAQDWDRGWCREQYSHNRKQWDLVLVPVCDYCEHYCIIY